MKTRIIRPLSALAIAAAATTAIAACSSSSSDNAATPTPTPTTQSASPTVSPTGATCTDESLTAALPEGSTIQRFNCADVDGTEWAAIRTVQGPTVFFATLDNGEWNVKTSDEVCGTASAGLPPVLLDYCS